MELGFSMRRRRWIIGNISKLIMSGISEGFIHVPESVKKAPELDQRGLWR